MAARLPPQPSSPQQPSTLQSGAHGSPARRVEAVRERGAREGPAAAEQRPPSSLRRAAAAGAPQLRGGPASRNARTTGRRSGAPRGSASAFPFSPARLLWPRPARGGGVGASRLCARRLRGPAAGRGARVRGVAALSSGRCGAAARARARWRSRGVVVTSQLLRGRVGEKKACKLSCSYFAPSSLYLWTEWNPDLPRSYPHPLLFSGPQLFPGPLVLGKGTGWPPQGRKALGEQWGVLGSGVQVRRAPAAAAGEKEVQDPMGCPARAAALCSFVPPRRRGLPWVSFPARDGIDSRSLRRKGRERGRNENQIRNWSPGGCLLGPGRGLGKG